MNRVYLALKQLQDYAESTANRGVADGYATLDATGNVPSDQLGNVEGMEVHDITGAYHEASGLTAGHFMKATGATTFGFATHGLTAADVSALALAGGVMAGTIDMAGNELFFDTPGTNPYTYVHGIGGVIHLNGNTEAQVRVGTTSKITVTSSLTSMNQVVSMLTNKITNLGTPTAGTDAATKDYADLMIPLTQRDANSGVATLDASGDVLAPGNSIRLTDDGASMYIVERGSSEGIVKFTRDGSNDYETEFNIGNAWQKVHRNATLADATDLNTVVDSGSYRCGTVVNGPTDFSADWGQLIVTHGSGDTISQIIQDYSGNLAWRNGNPTDVGGIGSWSSWQTAATKQYVDDNSSAGPTVSTRTTTYTAGTDPEILLCNGTFTVTLPAASTAAGVVLNIKNIGTGTVTIDGSGSETIDGATTLAIDSQYDSYTIVCNGSAWYII